MAACFWNARARNAHVEATSHRQAWKSGAIDGAFCRAELCENLYADGARLLMSASLFGSYSQPTWTMLVTSRAFAAERGDDLAAFLGVAAAADAHYIEEGAAGKSSYWPVRREDEFLAAIADAHEYLGPGTSRYDPADSGDRSHVQQTPVWKSNLQPDFNVRVCDRFDAISSAVLRKLDESKRSVQKSAETTSI